MSWSVRCEASLGPLKIDVAIESEGGVLALVGPNGAGKSTLLRFIAGAPIQGKGELTLGALTLVDAANEVRPEQRGIGFLPQRQALFSHLSVLENVAFGLRLRSHASVQEAARGLLDEFGAGHLADSRVHELSGGERQRVALARLFSVESKLLLLDEPFAALDPAARKDMRAVLAKRLHDHDAVLVTHDVRDVAALAPDVLVLEDGKVCQRGDRATLTKHPASAFVAEFFAPTLV